MSAGPNPGVGLTQLAGGPRARQTKTVRPNYREALAGNWRLLDLAGALCPDDMRSKTRGFQTQRHLSTVIWSFCLISHIHSFAPFVFGFSALWPEDENNF